MTDARLSGNARWILCGSCFTPLARREEWRPGTWYAIFAPEWRNDSPGRIYRGPRVKRGWVRVLTGAMKKPAKSFPLATPVECPACHSANDLRGLGLSEPPRSP